MLGRLFQIVFTICRYYLKGLPKPVRIRMIFQDLGGALVKFGQILALRSDLVPEDLAFELLHLLDRMPAIPFLRVRQAIRTELGEEIERLFAQFEQRPAAAASFAQIHRARIFDSQEVIVKIQRPGIEKLIKTDLAILMLGARIFDIFFRGPVKARQVVKEFSSWTSKELDYEREAKNAEFLGGPKIFWEYTTKKILVEEFIKGESLKQILTKGESIPNGEKVSHDLVAKTMEQYFLRGFYHADPHPGNIFVSDKGELAYVDFGIVGEGSQHFRIAMANFVKAAVEKEYGRAVNYFLQLGLAQRLARDLPHLLMDKKFADIFVEGLGLFKKIFIRRFAKLMGTWFEAAGNPEASFEQKSAAKTFLKLLKIASIYRVVLNSEVVLFIKTLIAVDAVSLSLNPHFNLPETIKSVFAQAPFQTLFSDSAKSVLVSPLASFDAPVKADAERTSLLKDYYMEWMGVLLAHHEDEFMKIFKGVGKQISKKEVPRPKVTSVQPERLPYWIEEMHKVLNHNHKHKLS